jgi:hypothetical protein
LNSQTASNRISKVLLTATLLLFAAQLSHAAQDPPKAQSVLDQEPIPRTPERLARGEYLVEGLLQCRACHSENDFSQRPF